MADVIYVTHLIRIFCRYIYYPLTSVNQHLIIAQGNNNKRELF